MRKYFLKDPLHPKGGITIECKDDHDCVFCERCTDVWWDYTNIIYMIACEDDHDPWERPCKYCLLFADRRRIEVVRAKNKDDNQRNRLMNRTERMVKNEKML